MADDTVVPGPWKEKPQPENVSEAWAAKCFEDQHAGELAFCIDTQKWFVWDGSTWRLKPRPQVNFLVHMLAVEMSGAEPPPKNRKQMQSNAYMKAVENLCRQYPTFTRNTGDWDRDIWLLGTPGGTVDLRTGILRPSKSDEMITKRCAVAPTAAARCPRWMAFLDHATGHNVEFQRYLQQVCGYTLTGETSEQQLWFFYGPGGSGKGVFINTLQAIMDEYAVTPPASVLEKQKFEGHSTDVAMMRGARLVVMSETNRGSQWNEARIKTLTGEDKITARLMRADNTSWQPQLTMWVSGNFAPALSAVDASIRRRMNVVPFRWRPQTVDKELKRKLQAEWPGILRWMIEGCLDWQENGLVKPKVVIEETDKYFSDQDVFSEWLETTCDVDFDNNWWTAGSSELYASWKAFADRAGADAGSTRTFRPQLEQLGFLAKRGRDGVIFMGLQLRARNVNANEPGDLDYGPSP